MRGLVPPGPSVPWLLALLIPDLSLFLWCPGHQLTYSRETFLVVTAPQGALGLGLLSPKPPAGDFRLDIGSSKTPRDCRMTPCIVGQTPAQCRGREAQLREGTPRAPGLCSDSPSVLYPSSSRVGGRLICTVLPPNPPIVLSVNLQEGSGSPSPGSRRAFRAEHRGRCLTQGSCSTV